MLIELNKMSEGKGFGMLSYFILMAIIEAKDILRSPIAEQEDELAMVQEIYASSFDTEAIG
ncbi:hypothetical protein DUT91_23925 [Phyllobacterium salinisoli]|uniref:Uncharacterized protein n=2 Tax=Phyllobacterium salinisoli TaxID=1899321 RepID=A0A368K0H4_9HYPH|nr:hypothetical protein DUT91_23925 [Phyllobacterium salinisoli]